MGKSIIVKEDSLKKIRESMVGSSNTASHNSICVNEARPEVDEYELGQESDNPPVGGNFAHVNESYNVSVRGDLDLINTIEFIPHENAREEGYEDDEIEDFEPYYEIEAMDMDGNTILYADLTVGELFDYFPQSVINDIIERDKSSATRLSNPSINQYRIEDILYRDTTPSDVNNVDEVNRIAKKIQTGGPSAYLLTDGDIIYFHDHIYINNIDGITPDKFIALGNIRLCNGGFELIKEPTRQQMYALKQWIRQNDRQIYVDFCEESSQTYPRTLFSVSYTSNNAERIVNDIYYYFEEGVKPQSNFYEGKNSEVIVENEYDDAYNDIINKLMEFKAAKAKEYGDEGWYNKGWMERKHPEVSVNPKDLEMLKALENKSKEITRLWSLSDDEEEASKSQTVKEESNIIELVTKHFGTTYNLRDAGYILPDGKLLNLHRGGDALDHRNIVGVYQENGVKIWSDEYRYNYVVDFMNHGAIRCDVNAGLLDMVCEPTKEQYSVIKDFVRKAEDVDIDFTNNVGDTQHSVSYSNAKPQRVVADIYNYFNEGIKPQGDFYEAKKKKYKRLIENLDFEVSSSDIDLSSFRKKTNLAPIWDENGELNPRIRLKLLDIADDFWNFVNLTWVKPNGIILTGSICNFNWSKFSDIDLHLIVDFDEIDEKTEFVRDYMDAKKNEWNSEHENLKILDYNVELYVQNLGEMPKSGGIYDLEENEWVKRPDSNDIKAIGLDKFSIKDKAANIMTIIDDMYDALNSTSDSHEIETIGDDAKYLWKKVKDMRRKSLEKSGESGVGNIVYKILRRTEYLEKLWKLSTIVYDRSNSIFQESIDRFKDVITVLKEEVVADGSSNGNPYEKRWKSERKALKDFICNNGILMQSKEDDKGGKLYKCFWDKNLSNMIGYNYCLCVQWDEVTMKPKSTVYIRACDRFTRNIRRNVQYDNRGVDNMRGTVDDVQYRY